MSCNRIGTGSVNYWAAYNERFAKIPISIAISIEEIHLVPIARFLDHSVVSRFVVY